jgi:alpha-glucosidase
VEVQKDDPYSHLNLYKRLVTLRQSEPSLMYGDYKPVHADHQALAFIRQAPNDKAFLIVLNLSHRPCYLKLEHRQISGKVILATPSELEGTIITERIQLSGDEGIIAELTTSDK